MNLPSSDVLATTRNAGRLDGCCKCSCGLYTIVLSSHLRRREIVSCGHHKAQQMVKGLRTEHGLSRGRLYGIWRGIHRRCLQKDNAGYPQYGGRGIKLCQRWQGKSGFMNFVSDMGPRPTPKHSVERIDNNGNYEPGNCKWATSKEQQRNRRGNRILELNGERMTLTDWAKRLGVPAGAVGGRLFRGFSDVQALTIPYVYDIKTRVLLPTFTKDHVIT